MPLPLIPLALVGPASALDDRLAPPPGDGGELAVMAIAQDPDGWIWFGGVEGLHRYDGERRVRWGGDFPGEANEILGSSGQTVTVFGQDRRVYALERAAWRQVEGPGGWTGAVTGAVESAGALWVLHAGRLWRSVAGSWTDLGPAADAHRLRTAADGVWVLGDDVRRVDGTGAVRERYPIAAATDAAARDGVTWIATKTDGIWRAEGPELARVFAVAAGEWAESVEPVADGAWIATTARVARIRGRAVRGEIAVPQGVPQHDALRIDRDGALWVATRTGPRLRRSPDTWLLPTPGATARGFLWLARAGDRTWASQWQGGGTFDEAGTWSTTSYARIAFPFCTTDTGRPVTVLETASPARTTLAELGAPPVARAELAPGDGLACHAAADGGLWLAARDGLRHVARDGEVRTVDAPVAPVRVVEDRAGVLHVLGVERECHAPATEARAGRASWACAALPPGQVWHAAEVEGRVWAVGMATGVLVETASGWARHVSSAALGSPSAWSLAPSPRGGVWLAGVGGVLRVAPSPPDEPWTELERVGSVQGLAAGGALHLVEADDGDLWLATERGVAVVPAAARGGPGVPPPPVLDEVWLDGAAVSPGAPLVAAWPSNQLELRGATPAYGDRSRMRWRARLGPDAPLTVSADPTLRIVDLPAGEYRISLQASLDEGATWSEPSAPLLLAVHAPWYLRPPAAIAAALALAAAAWGIARARAAAALRLERERSRIAMDLHDDLGGGLATLSMLTDLASAPDLDDAARREVAAEASQTAATLAQSLADIVWTLRRDRGSPGVLARSLVERARRLFGSGTPRLVVEVAAEWPDRLLPLGVFRSVQLIGYEALQNVARHADAETVVLRFHPWTLEILDDGRGLTALSPHAGTGTGLSNMRDRARAIGARLEIADRPGGGTAVRLRFDPDGR